MNSRKIACAFAATFIGVALTVSATDSLAKPRGDPVVVVANKVDPHLQRRVSYADLNLAVPKDQRTLGRRIHQTADNLCIELNGAYNPDRCTRGAVRSTNDQVGAAIQRAQRLAAGLPVGPSVAISMVIGAR